MTEQRTVELRFQCGHSRMERIAVNTWTTPTYGVTLEQRVAQRVLASAEMLCGKCYDKEVERVERLRFEQESLRLAQLRAESAAYASPPKPLPKCALCDEPATMGASLGPACPEHYDELSG